MQNPKKQSGDWTPTAATAVNAHLRNLCLLCCCAHALVFNRNSILDLGNVICLKFCQTVSVKVEKFHFQQVVTLQWKNI